MKVYLVIADKTPVLTFSSQRAAEQMCALRPDLHVREFNVPDDLGPDNVKVNLKELFALKQSLHGEPEVEPAGLDGLVSQREPIQRKLLEMTHKMMAKAVENPDLPATALMRLEEGQCQQRQCPGMMAYALLSLK